MVAVVLHNGSTFFMQLICDLHTFSANSANTRLFCAMSTVDITNLILKRENLLIMKSE
jgi:hypothetical protein